MGITLAIGIVLGALGSVPIAGPLAAIALKLCLDRRFAVARSVSIGAGIAEGAYAYLAYFGVTRLLGTHSWLATASQLIAAAVLAALGIHFLRRGAGTQLHPEDGPRRGGERRGILLGLTIGGSNPTMLASWSAVVAFVRGTGLVDLQPAHAPAFGLGVALGVALWFFVIVGLAERHQARMLSGRIDRLVRVTGAVLLLLGIALAGRLAATHWHAVAALP